jgi:hypothetical protein
MKNGVIGNGEGTTALIHPANFGPGLPLKYKILCSINYFLRINNN